MRILIWGGSRSGKTPVLHAVTADLTGFAVHDFDGYERVHRIRGRDAGSSCSVPRAGARRRVVEESLSARDPVRVPI